MKGRIRTIKPELALDEELWRVCQMMPAEPVLQVYQMLWCYADREERFEWRPMALRAVCVPYYTGDISVILDLLLEFGFLQKYRVDGKDYGIVHNLKKHQRFNSREPKSTIPGPTSIADLATPHARTRTHAHAQEEMEVEMEGKGSGTGSGSGLNREPGSGSKSRSGPDCLPDSEMPFSGPVYEVPLSNSESPTPKSTHDSSGVPKPDSNKLTIQGEVVIDHGSDRLRGNPPQPRRTMSQTKLQLGDYKPSGHMLAYAAEVGLTKSQVDDLMSDFFNKTDDKKYTIDFLDRRVLAFIKQEIKPSRNGYSKPAPERQPSVGAVNWDDYLPKDDHESAV